MASPQPTVEATLAVAIPAFNEADGIAEFLTEFDAALGELVPNHRFVVVDDCSTDETVAVLESLKGALTGGLEVYQGVENRGHGPTVVAAYQACLALNPNQVLQVDGDGQFNASDLAALFSASAAADVVTGNRHRRVDPWFRKVVTLGVRGLLRVGFGVDRVDTNCPLRLYRSRALNDMLPLLPDSPLVPHVELTILEERAEIKCLEIPVTHRVRRGTGEVGSTWQATSTLASVARLARFCGRALVEVVRFRLAKPWASAGPGGS